MVKLAKRHNKTFETLQVAPPKELRLIKTGVYDFDAIVAAEWSNIKHRLTHEAVMLVSALYFISDKNNEIETNDQLQLLAIHLFEVQKEMGKGKIDVDSYRQMYKFYWGIMDSIWKTKRYERRKAKKFGDPKFPTCDEMFAALDELRKAKLINEDGSLGLNPYDRALWKQKMIEAGYGELINDISNRNVEAQDK